MKRIFYSIAVAALALLSLVSCKDDLEPVSFAAAIEQPEEYQNGKNYLSDEHFILWDEGDAIAVRRANASGVGTGDVAQALCTTGGVRESGFYGTVSNDLASAINNNRPWIGVFPASAYHQASGTLIYPSTMPYRGDAMGDLTFGKDCFPMVAFNNTSGSTALGFHSVSGILRFQLYSGLEAKEIDYIEFSSHSSVPYQKLSGNFTINNITEYNPYLTDYGTLTDADRKITITNINQSIGAGTTGRGTSSGHGQLLTFYLPLPAKSDGTGANLTQYVLTMTVHNASGEVFVKHLKADIRRNAINKMPAIEVTEWAAASGSGVGNIQMVGCGTRQRPFQIYTYDDLVKARNACNTTNGTINGQAITEETWFVVKRIDIRLDVEGSAPGHYGDYDPTQHHSQYQTCGPWTEGFRNFRGHFVCASNHPELHGIINNSHVPLFESISPQGSVDSVTVRTTVPIHITNTTVNNFSPLCLTNNGKMSNCVNQCNVTCDNGNVAGICVTNASGAMLHGCRNEGNLTALGGKYAAGLCLTNNGIVRRTQQLTSAILKGAQVGGLVHTNNQKVEASYVNLGNGSAEGHFGGIVYSNTGDVKNCYVSGSLILQSPYTAGGIVNTNVRGNILGCYNRMLTLQGSGNVGGICAVMNGGVMRNCYVDGEGNASITSNSDAAANVGGFVGYLTAGVIENGYSVASVHNGSSLSGNQAGNIVAKIQAGTSEVKIWNCYGTANIGFVGSYSGSDITISQCYARSAINDGDGIQVSPIWLNSTYHVFLGTEADHTDNFHSTLQGNLDGHGDRYNSWIAGNHPVLSASK